MNIVCMVNQPQSFLRDWVALDMNFSCMISVSGLTAPSMHTDTIPAGREGGWCIHFRAPVAKKHDCDQSFLWD